MLYSVFEFGDTTAREIMTPRVDVVVLEDTASLDETLHVFHDEGFSRLPIYHDTSERLSQSPTLSLPL